MKLIENEEIKRIELDILTRIDEVCQENGLKYFLCGGTLLGAVRHKGFIPWDDDIDIFMPRSDYEILLKIFENEESYAALSPFNEGYYYNFTKIVDKRTELKELGCIPFEDMGVYVDVFPLDGMPSESSDVNRHYKRLNYIRNMIFSFAMKKPKIRKNIFALFKSIYIYYIRNRLVKLGNLQNKYKAVAKEYSYESSDYVYATGGAYGKKEIFSKKIFDNTVKLEFEGKYFNAPGDWDGYLKQLYGDYMQLPPIEKRVSHHNFEASYREK